MKPKLIIISHGYMAKETLKSAEMIVGEILDTNVISMLDEDGIPEVTTKLSNVLSQIGNNPVLIITDLLGKTPFNVAMSTLYKKEDIAVISGLNLSMLVEYAKSCIESLDELANHLVQVGGQGIYKLKITSLEDEDGYKEIIN